MAEDGWLMSTDAQSLLLAIAMIYTPLLWAGMMLLALKVQERERKSERKS